MNKKTDRKVPEVRFKGFTDDWEQRKLLNSANYIRGSFPQPYGNKKWYGGPSSKPFVQVVDVGQNLKLNKNTKEQISILAQPKSRFVPRGSVVVTLQGSIGRVAITQYDSYADRTLLIFTKYKIPVDKVFWAYSVQNIFRIEKQKAPGGTIKTITKRALSSFKVDLTVQEEQRKIGKILKNIDTVLYLQQKKLEQLQTLEKFLLKNLLAQGEYPVIRFKKFSGPWKLWRLGDLGTITSGVGFPVSEQGGHEGVPFFKVSDMSSADNNLIMKTANNYVVNQQIEDNSWHPITKLPAIIFAKVGAALMLNRKRLVLQPFLIDNNTMAYSLNSTWNEYFAISLFQTINLPRYAQIGALPSFNATEIKDIKVSIPTKAEQDQIGKFLKGFWDTINLQKQKIAYFESLKQFLLQKMFI